jgi:hypothetical protein
MAIELLEIEAFGNYNIEDIKTAFNIKYTSPEITAEEYSDDETDKNKVKDLWVPVIYWRHDDVCNDCNIIFFIINL